jgi:hypothetical protein
LAATTAAWALAMPVEFALVAVEDGVLGGLDDEQRETLYTLLQQATGDHAPDCPTAIDE